MSGGREMKMKMMGREKQHKTEMDISTSFLNVKDDIAIVIQQRLFRSAHAQDLHSTYECAGYAALSGRALLFDRKY